MSGSVEEAFRRLAIGDPRVLADLSRRHARAWGAPSLDARTGSLLRVAVLVALDAPPSTYRMEVDAAVAAGADLADLLAVLATVSGLVGSARVASAAPSIALAAGYDVEEALEALSGGR